MRLTSRPTLICIRVHTDEGLIGLGESWFGCAAGRHGALRGNPQGAWRPHEHEGGAARDLGLRAAKVICAALESIGPDWVEDPIWMDRTADIAELTASTRAPLAGGETLGGLGQLRELITVGRIGTPIIDLSWGGGVTFARKAAALAEAFAKPIAFHDCSGPVTLTVSTHLAMACPNVAEQEITRAFYYGWYHECLDRLPPIEQGRIRAPEGSGLGVALHPDLLLRHDVVTRTSGS